jgi:hypothetical protein
LTGEQWRKLGRLTITTTPEGLKMNFDYKRMIKFEYNIGDKEKNQRMAIGAALVFISIFTAKIILLLVGLVLIATGYSGWCPIFSGFNKNTKTSNNTNS